MSCANCFDNCADGPIADRCIKYTGDPIPLLGICTGDTLSEVEEIIITKLLSYTDGTGVSLSGITIGCTFLTTILAGKDKTLANLVQMLVDANCSLRDLITTLQTQANTIISFNTSCLEGLTSSSTKDQILQAAINKICSIDTRVENIENDYVKTTDLNTLIQNYFIAQAASAQQYTKLVPYIAYEYYGSLSNFDSSGKGLSSAGFSKIYICNGQTVNGFATPDKRGRVAVGAVSGVPGGALDSAVDPTLASNPGTNYVLKQKTGSSFTTLSSSQIPASSATIPAQSVTINLPGQRGGDNNDNNNTTRFAGGDKNPDETSFNFTLPVSFTIPSHTVTLSGGGQPHDNRQPSIAAYFIMYIP